MFKELYILGNIEILRPNRSSISTLHHIVFMRMDKESVEILKEILFICEKELNGKIDVFYQQIIESCRNNEIFLFVLNEFPKKFNKKFLDKIPIRFQKLIK